jgi:3-oxoadipate enol-lactonase
MAEIRIRNCSYYFEMYGQGPETIVLAHGLLWSGEMFHKQVRHFKEKYRIIVYDHRGQGRSEVTPRGYDMDELYKDAVALIEALELGPVHFGGLSMGGFIGLRIAARRPDLLRSLILMETSAQAEPNIFKYGILNMLVKLFGVASVAGPVMKIMFGEAFLNDPSRKEERETWRSNLLKNKKTIVRAVEGVLRRKGVEAELQNIQCPTLILVGTDDKATTPEKAEFLNSNISNSKLVYVQDAGHTACIEAPKQYNEAIQSFLEGVQKTSV